MLPKTIHVRSIIAITVALIMVLSVPASFSSVHVKTGTSASLDRIASGTGANSSAAEFNSLMVVNRYVMPVVHYSIKDVIHTGFISGQRTMNVVVGFNPSNMSDLADLLANINNPDSTYYHHYLTAEEFDSEFGANYAVYSNFMGYLRTKGIPDPHTYGDRLVISFSAPESAVQAIFNTTIGKYASGTMQFYAPQSEPELPSVFVPFISGIAGLSNYSVYVDSMAPLGLAHASGTLIQNGTGVGGFLSPVTIGNTQYIYAPDTQIAYNEQTLFTQFGYPTHSVEATILWSGEYTGSTITTPYGVLAHNQDVGPFVPSNVYDFYNETLPSYEPHSRVYGVPLSGAPAPGPLAAFDKTGAFFENTLDLEMMGSTAPGSSIYNVYGPSPSTSDLEEAFSFILNPNASYSALNNVSVISNSWGSTDANNSIWMNDLAEAQARGITVLASSGDSGDNQNSQKYTGSETEFPSTMAYNDFGTVAVGGTTLNLTSSLGIQNQVNWYISANDTSQGGPAGTTSGISSVFSEPDWQQNSSANYLINGSGRAVPDLSALANNTLVTITVGNYTYYATNATTGNSFEYAWGTSVASPLTAGMIAEMDTAMNATHQGRLGFIDPLAYRLGTMEYQSLSQTDTTGYLLSGLYNYSIPMIPFSPIIHGRNHIYHDRFGYSLLNGWGSLNAYNFTAFAMDRNFNFSQSALAGVDNNLSLRYLNVTSYNFTGSVYTMFNASVQQNLFLANEMGQPIYWIQNVIYINGSNSTGFTVNYSGWVVYPFYGLYPSLSNYRYDYPAGEIIKMPHHFNMTTVLNYDKPVLNRTISFYVNSHEITIPVPGAAYIIGEYNYSYYFGNSTYYNGPYPDNNVPGGLDPEFGLVGGPSGNNGSFAIPTSGNLTSLIMPMGSTEWTSPETQVFSLSNDQTGETASNLQYTKLANSRWQISISRGSESQGILSYSRLYSVTLKSNSLPSGLPFTVNVQGIGSFSSSSGSVELLLNNGTYNATVQGSDNYSPYPSQIEFSVSGVSLNIIVSFASPINSTIGKISSTYDVLNKRYYQGDFINVSILGDQCSFAGPAGIAENTSSGIIYATLADGKIARFNSTNHRFLGSINIGSNTEPVYDYFDTLNGLLYVSDMGTGNLTVLNAKLGVVVKNITLGNASDRIDTVTGFGNYVYALGSNGILYVINTLDNDISSELRVFESQTSTYEYTLLTHGDNILTLNMSGDKLVSINMTTMKIINISLNAGPKEVPSQVYIGSDNQIYVAYYSGLIQVFNGNSFSIVKSMKIGGVSFAGTFDSLNSILYLNVENSTMYGGMGEFVMINSVNNSVISSIPASYAAASMIFIGSDQAIYSANAFTGTVSYIVPDRSYTVTVDETGLPSGTCWGINLSSGQRFNSSGNSINFYTVNGTYSYSLFTSNSNYSSEQDNGTITVNGSNYNLFISYSYLYPITFSESGLPISSMWYVNITQSSGKIVSKHGESASLGFSLVNGTYTYSVSTGNKDYFNHTIGKIQFDGGIPESVNVLFEPYLYDVAFSMTGLPSGTVWYVNITGQPGSGSIASNSHSISLINGTYSYTIATADKAYSPDPLSGSFTVNGAPVAESVTFVQVTYTVTFTESGLPAGTEWYVNVTGLDSGAITGTSYSTSLTNGTYSYTIDTSDKSYAPSLYAGSFIVNGAPPALPTLKFSPVEYSVVFTEKGLPSGTTWYVNLSNGSSYHTSSSTMTLLLINGTYSFTISKVSGYNTETGSGSFSVSGSSPPNEIIVWSPVPAANSSIIYYVLAGIAVIAIIAGVAIFLSRKKR